MKLLVSVLAFLYFEGALSQTDTTMSNDVGMTTLEAGTRQATIFGETTMLKTNVSNETTTSPTTTSTATTISLSEPSTSSTKPVTTAEATTPSTSCGTPPNNGTSSCVTSGCTANVARKVSYAPGRICIDVYTCNSGNWTISSLCSSYYCAVPGMFGANCTEVCGGGCPGDVTKSCDVDTGKCTNASSGQTVSKCLEGYKGDRCQEPICPLGCAGGECLIPNFCGNCPKHFESGPTCRNIRLDGFLAGSLPSLAILSLIIILLTVASKWYIRRKIKEN